MVDASCGGTFMTKSEDEAWELFETLSYNSMHHASVSRSDRFTPTIMQNKSGVYESEHSVDIHNKVDMLTQKLDQILSVGRGQVSIFTPATQQEVCSLSSSPTHFVNNCHMAAHTQNLFSNKFKQPKVSIGQLMIHFSTLTILGRNHPNFSWRFQSQPP